VQKCTYSLKSTRTFKEKITAVRHKFDPKIYEQCSCDACSLFTSINCERTVDYITNKIYSNINQFFPITEETPNPPLRELFKEYFKTKYVLSMGGKLSPSLASILVQEKQLYRTIWSKTLLFHINDMSMMWQWS